MGQNLKYGSKSWKLVKNCEKWVEKSYKLGKDMKIYKNFKKCNIKT